LTKAELILRVSRKTDLTREVVAVQLTRQHMVDVLRRAGLPELAEAARRELPDPVDSEQAAAWAVPYGVNMDDLISRMGGSP
jgi:hypothetical protein